MKTRTKIRPLGPPRPGDWAKPIAAALWAISRTWRKRANNKYAPWPGGAE